MSPKVAHLEKKTQFLTYYICNHIIVVKDNFLDIHHHLTFGLHLLMCES